MFKRQYLPELLTLYTYNVRFRIDVVGRPDKKQGYRLTSIVE